MWEHYLTGSSLLAFVQDSDSMFLLSVDLSNAACGSMFIKHQNLIWGNRVSPSERCTYHLSTLDLDQHFQYMSLSCIFPQKLKT